MKKWEYKICFWRDSEEEANIEKMPLFLEELNDLGKQGWRVIGTNIQEINTYVINYYAIMEREIPDLPAQAGPPANSKFFDSDARSPVPLTDQDDYYVDDPRR